MWAREIEDGGDVVVEISFNAVLLDKIVVEIMKLKEKLVQMKNEDTREPALTSNPKFSYFYMEGKPVCGIGSRRTPP